MVPEAAAGKNTPERRLCATAALLPTGMLFASKSHAFCSGRAGRECNPSVDALAGSAEGDVPRATSSPWTYTIGPKAVSAACALVDPNPCILKSELNCPACPVRLR